MKRSEYQAPMTESIAFLNNGVILMSPGSNEGTGNENWAPAFPDLPDLSDPTVLTF